MLRRARRSQQNRRTRLNLEVLEDRWAPAVVLGQQPGAPNTTQFHGDPWRTGFNQNETSLTPANVATSFGQVRQSPVLDGHLYALDANSGAVSWKVESEGPVHATAAIADGLTYITGEADGATDGQRRIARRGRPVLR